MRKSTTTTRNYRPGGSRGPVALSTLRQQMADYARAERLRELREASHLSREKVASEIGVSTKTLYAWENGGSIRWENTKKIAAFYEVEPESLVSRELVEPAASSENGSAPADVDPAALQAQLNRIEDMLTVLLGHHKLQAALKKYRARLAAESQEGAAPGRRRAA